MCLNKVMGRRKIIRCIIVIKQITTKNLNHFINLKSYYKYHDKEMAQHFRQFSHKLSGV